MLYAKKGGLIMLKTNFDLIVDGATIVAFVKNMGERFFVDLTKSYEMHAYSRRKEFVCFEEAISYYFEIVKRISDLVLSKKQIFDIFTEVS
jgi:hypothetical protein